MTFMKNKNVYAKMTRNCRWPETVEFTVCYKDVVCKIITRWTNNQLKVCDGKTLLLKYTQISRIRNAHKNQFRIGIIVKLIFILYSLMKKLWSTSLSHCNRHVFTVLHQLITQTPGWKVTKMSNPNDRCQNIHI